VTKKRKGKKKLLYEYGYLDVVDEMLCTDDDDVGGIWIKLE
jgi:hypothetical protein